MDEDEDSSLKKLESDSKIRRAYFALKDGALLDNGNCNKYKQLYRKTIKYHKKTLKIELLNLCEIL